MALFDGQPYKAELARRLDAIRNIVDTAHPASPDPGRVDISRDARGIAVLLLFASYENLLTSLCRGLLEAAAHLRVGNRNLKNGFRLFAVHGDLKAISDSSGGRLWKELGLRVMDTMSQSQKCTVDVNLFPADGSFMKRSQVRVFCNLFDLDDPGPILKEVWARLDTIVAERNGIAHGSLTPAEVGRNYTLADTQALIYSWQVRWTEFIVHVESKAASRDFFRIRR